MEAVLSKNCSILGFKTAEMKLVEILIFFKDMIKDLDNCMQSWYKTKHFTIIFMLNKMKPLQAVTSDSSRSLIRKHMNQRTRGCLPARFVKNSH